MVRSQDKISSIRPRTKRALRRFSFGVMSGAPLFLKLVNPIKIARSWAANEFRIHQLLIAQADSQMRAAHTSVLRETDSAVGKEVAGFNLADRSFNELAEFVTL